MFGWALRVLVLLLVLMLVLRFVFRFLRAVMEGMATPSSPRADRRAGTSNHPSVALVKDPVCGTYVPKTRALAATTSGGTHYFCSEACRERYLREARR
jgi:YHS domain-containing protein